MKTQVAVIGAGPAGMLLSEMLARAGIESVVIERQSRDHVLGRIRAGVLEQSTVEVLSRLGLAERLHAEGHVHDGMKIVWSGRSSFFIDCATQVGKRFTAYGQTRIQEDLFLAADRRRARIEFEAEDVRLSELDSAEPLIEYRVAGQQRQLRCDFIAGCDGFHGASRRSVPAGVLREYEKIYPFGWLGVLAPTPPLPEIVYANHPRGFALASMRNPQLARFYIQVPLSDSVDDWPDARFWPELIARFPPDLAAGIQPAPPVEKSIAPLRSFVTEPMQFGRLFLAGDAAHIVPPTGAKGLNLAVSDVTYLGRALVDFYRTGRLDQLDDYSTVALRRVWHSVRTSWYLTNLLHRFPEATDFDQRAQEYELEFLKATPSAQRALAEQYAGLPIEGSLAFLDRPG
ncbi:MAG: 4-hydroxybenzoate 3-monooxygenase [Betaproteobacteria bacterium]|jgi:p-hydroxybenzoate 3-monooxygenase|nr:4-hydroxybenzoate 3-monooxygenase [Betaproteobacteria bacterium]